MARSTPATLTAAAPAARMSFDPLHALPALVFAFSCPCDSTQFEGITEGRHSSGPGLPNTKREPCLLLQRNGGLGKGCLAQDESFNESLGSFADGKALLPLHRSLIRALLRALRTSGPVALVFRSIHPQISGVGHIRVPAEGQRRTTKTVHQSRQLSVSRQMLPLAAPTGGWADHCACPTATGSP